MKFNCPPTEVLSAVSAAGAAGTFIAAPAEADVRQDVLNNVIQNILRSILAR